MLSQHLHRRSIGEADRPPRPAMPIPAPAVEPQGPVAEQPGRDPIDLFAERYFVDTPPGAPEPVADEPAAPVPAPAAPVAEEPVAEPVAEMPAEE